MGESQGGDLHYVGAAHGLDAGWGLGGDGRRGRPALVGGPVEAVSLRGQSRGRLEADDRRGDLAPPAVDPAAVLGLLVQTAAARGREGRTDRRRKGGMEDGGRDGWTDRWTYGGMDV